MYGVRALGYSPAGVPPGGTIFRSSAAEGVFKAHKGLLAGSWKKSQKLEVELPQLVSLFADIGSWQLGMLLSLHHELETTPAAPWT